MASKMASKVFFLLAIVCFFSSSFAASKYKLGLLKPAALTSERSSRIQTYIVHVTKPETFDFTEQADLERFYKSFLPTTTEGFGPDERLVYSFQHVASGFAARLTELEAEELLKKDGVVSAEVDVMLNLHTTHTPNFLGLQQNLGVWRNSSFGKGVIIGVLDTGILPTHPSFDDQDMPSPPAKWKGKCDFTSCNKKLIGARNFDSSSAGSPPVDDEGHGTHTSSTAAGAFVKGANVLGNAEGTAAGMAPYAHLAMYKVCSEFGCSSSDILAGMDAAIEDGVDILSLSLGGPSRPFFADSIAIGAFAATQKGILVSCSAGNSGPISSSVSNEAPWIFTIGASTVDRSIQSTVKLGNGVEYDGESLFQPKTFQPTQIPLVFPGESSSAAALCVPGSLDGSEVAGKVVLCQRGGGIGRIAKGQTVKDAGGVAMILMNAEIDGYSTLADFHVLPASHIAFAEGDRILAYINSSAAPTAALEFKGTVLGIQTAPAVSSFSSRGPAEQVPGILKPDIIGPGVSILAAWPFQLDNSSSPTEATFNMISGTSMSCPHLSGIAALLKSSHPDWTPAAIRSAIMTSADQINVGKKPIVDQTLTPADRFAIGAGHVNPSKANDPGLIYDIQPDDYLPFLCGLNYTDAQVAVIAQKTVKCSSLTPIPQAQLNYPSISIELGSSTVSVSRTFINVGKATSHYTINIVSPFGVQVSTDVVGVKFSKLGQTMTYNIRFIRTGGATQSFVEGSVTWVSDDGYSVRSPIVVKFA
ncbi:unnamed protein product [Rhodiola kirilowii]